MSAAADRQARLVRGDLARRTIGLGALLAASIFYLTWQLTRLDAYQYAQSIYPIDDADEWRYTACSRLVEHGYALFTQVFSAQPPLLFLSLAGSMRLLGDSIGGARGAEIAFGMVSLAAACWTAWMLAGCIAGAAAALLLAVSPGFLVYSHAVEGEGPMMALVTLSLALLLRCETRQPAPGRPPHALLVHVLAGLALAGAILVKLFALEALAPALWLLASRRGQRRSRLLVFGATALVPVALDFGLVAPGAQWDQVVLMHQRIGALPNTLPNWQILREFLTLDAGLSLLALSGLLILAALRRWQALGFMLLWLPGSVVMLDLFHPLFPHHPAILLSALAVAAGTAVGLALQEVRTRPLLAAPVALALATYIALSPRLAHADRHLVASGVIPREHALAAFVDARTSPSDFVATDDLAVAEQANRLVPPPLCDPSNVRLHAGYLTAQDLERGTLRYHARLVLPSFGIYEQVPGYMSWLQRHFYRLAAPDGVTAYRWRG